MTANLLNALIITAVGMGLVFASIVLLWGVMALLVRVTAERPEAEEPTAAEAQLSEREIKQRAAIAAVAAALAREAAGWVPFAAPQTSAPSPWQSVMRGRQLKQRGPLR